jgi:hypothetical protein
MADYTQPTAVFKRVRFFDGQFLQDQDFIDEQKYHLDRERRVSTMLGIAGVLRGLAVSGVTGTPYAVRVGQGIAVDDEGRQLVLADDVTFDLPQQQFAKKQNVAIWIVFAEAATDIAQTGGKSARRWDETPTLAATAPDGSVAVFPAGAATAIDPSAVQLATVSVSDKGDVVVNQAAAQRAGLSIGGAVGIGTSTPKAQLDVVGGGGLSVDLQVNGRLRSGNDDGGLWINQDRFVGGYDDRIGFFNQSVGWGLMMNRRGDVGIGIVDPENAENWAKVVDVFGGTNNAKLSVRTSTIDGRVMAHPGIYGAPGGLIVGTKTNHSLSFVTGGATQMSVLNSGNVVIGGASPTAKPAAKLEIIGAGALNVDLVVNGRLRSNNNDGGLWVAADRFIGGFDTDKVGFFTGNKEWSLTVTRLGHVGIGVTDPENAENWARVLDLYGGTNNAKLAVRTNAIDGRMMAHPGIYGAPGGLIVGTKTNHAVSLISNGTSRLTVLGTGAVGIGTPKPGAALEVMGGGGTTIDLLVNGRLQSNNKDGGLWIAADRFVGGYDDKIGFFNNSAGWGLVMNRRGDVGIGTGDPENVENWARVLDLYGGANNAKLAVRTSAIDGRMMAHPGIYGAQAGLIVGTKSGHSLSFMTSGASRMTVTADGKVGIGVEPIFPLNVLAGADHVQLRRAGTQTTGGHIIFLEMYQEDSAPSVPEVQPSIRFHHGNRFWHRLEADAGGFHFKHGYIISDAYVPATAARWNTPSDARLKQDVVELAGALDTIERLRGVTFTWKDGSVHAGPAGAGQAGAGPAGAGQAGPGRADIGRDIGRADIGLVAQEVEAVLPQLVQTDGKGYKSMDYGKLTAVLVQAVKEQQRSIGALRERIATMEGHR